MPLKEINLGTWIPGIFAMETIKQAEPLKVTRLSFLKGILK
jgi:hypothetical protein